MAAASRKRPAPDADGDSSAAARGGSCKKKQALAVAAAYNDYEFRSIRDYELMEEIGKGSYGVVVKARDRRTGETIRDLAADEATGQISLVMEFVGPSLRACLRQRGRFSEAETRSFMRQLLSATKTMHGVKLIHRDMKPANILIGGDDPGGANATLKICDFGAATARKPAGTPYPEPRVGTLFYRSPEQLQGDRCYGPGVDVWALGCVMVELLTGEPLFGKADSEEEVLIMAAQLRDQVVSAGSEAFNGLPEPLSLAGREVLRGLLRFDPEERFSAAEALEHRWFAEDDDKT
ncbi:hypothetical protein QOZ80_6AG0519930 [Eleusine coracana subsp. coracana]|nr:hypothetical protein QOZ80_6AG0519930 [Eleusine coracana subsp. coracana]